MTVKNIKMESKDELKEIDIKNSTCYYFDDIMGAWEKFYKENNENILIYDISYKTSTSAKSSGTIK